MKIHAIRRPKAWLAAALLLLAHAAHAAVTCSIAPSPAVLQAIYAAATNLDGQGTFNVTCSRNPSTDARRQDIWIGVDQPSTGRALYRDIGGSQLSYFIYRKTWGAGVWGNSGNFSANQNSFGGLQDTIDFGNGGAVVTASYTFYVRVPSGQNRPAGVYTDPAVSILLRLGSDLGAVVGSATLGGIISIQHDCRFSTDPTPVNATYQAFSAAAVSGTSNFALTCTQGTTYTLSLDATRGIVPNVQLAYTLSLNSTTGTGTAVAQPFSVVVNFLAGQAGTCATASCQGTDTRTITVTY
jgi:spore coat protein U-like protein